MLIGFQFHLDFNAAHSSLGPKTWIYLKKCSLFGGISIAGSWQALPFSAYHSGHGPLPDTCAPARHMCPPAWAQQGMLCRDMFTMARTGLDRAPFPHVWRATRPWFIRAGGMSFDQLEVAVVDSGSGIQERSCVFWTTPARGPPPSVSPIWAGSVLQSAAEEAGS